MENIRYPSPPKLRRHQRVRHEFVAPTGTDHTTATAEEEHGHNISAFSMHNQISEKDEDTLGVSEGYFTQNEVLPPEDEEATLFGDGFGLGERSMKDGNDFSPIEPSQSIYTLEAHDEDSAVQDDRDDYDPRMSFCTVSST